MSKVDYKSKKWERKRNYILKRDSYLCQECLRYGTTTEGTEVHHVNPAEQRNDLFYTDWNLITLCKKCHGKMHDRKNDELTAVGITLLRRIEKSCGIK